MYFRYKSFFCYILLYFLMICGLPLLFLFFFKFIYLFLAVLDLHCCVRVFSSCSEQRLLLIEVCRWLLIVEHRL